MARKGNFAQGYDDDNNSILMISDWIWIGCSGFLQSTPAAAFAAARDMSEK